MSDPTFRFAAPADTQTVVALIERAYRGLDNAGAWTSEAHLLTGPRTSDEEIAALIARDDSRFVLAERDARVAGCCLVQGHDTEAVKTARPGQPAYTDTFALPNSSASARLSAPAPKIRGINAAYFGMFAIDPAGHGAGLGKLLIAEAERRVRDLWRCNQMVMTVINLRTELIEWYQRRGYRLRRLASLSLQRNFWRDHPRLLSRRDAQGPSLMPRYVALLRAVNVGGRKVTMKELREAVEAEAFTNVRTLVASGNLVFDTKKAADAKLEAALETLIEKTFGLFSEVMVRNPAEWAAILKANPFAKKAKDDPAHLVCLVCKDRPDARAIDVWMKGFREKHDKGEKLKVVGREIFIDYGDSIGESKLVLPKKMVTGTARNWNTMLKLDTMLND